MRSSTTQSDSPYITDQSLNRHPSNYIVRLLFLPQGIVLFEGNLRIVSHVGFKQDQECKQIGAQRYRRSKATCARSLQSPSLPTASSWCLGRPITRCGSGIRQQGCCSRCSRATRTRSPQSPSLPTASSWRLGQTMTRRGSGIRQQGRFSRRSRATRARSAQSPSPLTVILWYLGRTIGRCGSGIR
jgi:hypothetical protein